MHNYTGNITRACVGNKRWAAPNVSQCNNTILMILQTQARKLLNAVTFNSTTVIFPRLLISLTVEMRDILNTTRTVPILPNDISVIINILETVLKYVYMFCKIYISGLAT